MNKHLITLSAAAAMLLCPMSLSAERADSLSRKPVHMIGGDVRPAYVFPTHGFLKGDNAAGTAVGTAFSAHLKYGFKFGRGTRLGRLYPHAVQGVGVSYNTFFNNEEIGSPVAVYIFQTSRIASLSRELSLDYEWNFGASFGWKKYDEDTNPHNTVVGSSVNAYMSLGLVLDWRIAPGTSLRAGLTATHCSNGNTAYPNAGINTLGGTIGIARTFGNVTGDDKERTYTSAGVREPFKRHVSYDIVAYWAMRKRAVYPPDGDPGMASGAFAVAGINFTPLYNFSKYLRAGLSLDMQYDESANIGGHIVDGLVYPDADNIRFHRPPFREQFSVGLSVRAEVVMPIFSINLGIGRNILCKGPDTDAFYQILALKTHLTSRLFLHVGYQLSRFKDPNNLMLGLGWRFGNK